MVQANREAHAKGVDGEAGILVSVYPCAWCSRGSANMPGAVRDWGEGKQPPAQYSKGVGSAHVHRTVGECLRGLWPTLVRPVGCAAAPASKLDSPALKPCL